MRTTKIMTRTTKFLILVVLRLTTFRSNFATLNIYFPMFPSLSETLPKVTYLEKEVRDTFIAAAGRQHEGCLTLVIFDVDVDPSVEEQVDDIVVTDVTRVHEGGPPTPVLGVQIKVSSMN